MENDDDLTALYVADLCATPRLGPDHHLSIESVIRLHVRGARSFFAAMEGVSDVEIEDAVAAFRDYVHRNY